MSPQKPKGGTGEPGPTSPEGNRRRMNARKIGIYSKDLVIESLGEIKTMLEECQWGFRSSFALESIADESLCDDAIRNWWRRERVRRCESNMIRAAIADVTVRVPLERDRQTKELKRKFLRLFTERERIRSSPKLAARNRTIDQVDNDIAEVRTELHKTGDGLQYLINTISGMKAESKKTGQLSPTAEALLISCLGYGDESGDRAVLASRIVRKEFGRKSEKPLSTDNSDPDEATIREKSNLEETAKAYREVVGLTLDIAISELKMELEKVRMLEQVTDNARINEAVVLASEKTSHAETRYDRRHYKAVTALYMIDFQRSRIGPNKELLLQLPRKSQESKE